MSSLSVEAQMFDEYLTCGAVAKLVGLTPCRVQQLADAGRLRVAAKAGPLRLFTLTDVQAFLQGRRHA
jgi:hypothetical protein